MMNDLNQMSEIELLRTHTAVLDELRCRGVVRTRNNPVGDYTEWLVCNRLGLEMQSNSQKSFDAIDANGIRYQIKGRRDEGTSVQFSSIRNLDGQGFDFVIAVVFNSDYSIRFAVMIPHQIVPEFAKYQEHTNAHNLILTDKICEQPGVTDIAHLIDEAEETPPETPVVPPLPWPAETQSGATETAITTPALPRRWRTENIQQAADALERIGYTCAAPPHTLRDVHIMAQSSDGSPNIKVICPGRLSIHKKYLGESLHICFPDQDGVWYLAPHDELVRIAGDTTPWLDSPSWQDNGWYSSANPSAKMRYRLRPFALNFGS